MMRRQTIVELQSLGVRVGDKKGNRQGGAGPAEGSTFIIDGRPVTMPVEGPFVSYSPYHLQKSQGSKYFLYKNNDVVTLIDKVAEPEFYDLSTPEGIQYSQIALLHGNDCLASTVIQKCAYWETRKRCRFCGIELSLKRKRTIEKKTPSQLAEVALAACEKGLVKHVLLTSGTTNQTGREVSYLASCARAIKNRTGLPIHVQFCPPEDYEEMGELKNAGVDTVGIHVESFDFEILPVIAPAKAKAGLKRYVKAWEKAVEIFGKNQVSSFLIAGIGEKEKTLIEGGRFLAERGVYPFVVPFRPIPGTLMDMVKPPSPEYMDMIYNEISRIITANDLSFTENKAGCVRCGACSAITLYEKPENHENNCQGSGK